MAVDLNNTGPTSDRINAATSAKQLESIRLEIQDAEYDCIAQRGWEAADVCNVVANALYFHISERAKALPKVASGSPITITVGKDGTPAFKPLVAIGDAAMAPASWLGLALLAGGAYYLWRYTRK